MKKIVTLLILFGGMLMLAACGGGDKEFFYPDFGYADENSDSWLQIGDDAPITINWFVNLSYFGTAAIQGTKVEEKIYEKTGIRINWVTPITDDGAQLSTMIAGNKLPDVITIGGGTDNRVQLAEEGYTYPIQELADRYAPTLLNRVSPDIKNYFKQSDGNIYGLPNHFYTQSDMTAYQEQEGRNLLPNGAILARKDYLDAYTSANPGEDPTTPQGFINMCLWVKNKYELSNSNPTVLLNHFNVNGSTAIPWLQEYFSVPRENAEGNLVNMYEQPENKEVFMFLNELYRNKLISEANFTAGTGTIGGYLSGGLPFVYVGSPQEYPPYFRAAYDNGVEYVPIVITNAAGDVPQLRSLAGNGWLFSMITTNAKRPDRIIKLFDYLQSEEGQSLFYGIKDEDWTYEVQPGESVEKTINGETKDVTYKYGLVKYNDDVWEDIQDGTVDEYGFGYFNILVNPMYPRLAGQGGEVLNSYNDYLDYNRKAPLIDYSYYIGAFEFTRDATASNYVDIINKANNINNLWVQYIPRIISADTKTSAEEIYDSVVNQSISMGGRTVLEFDNLYFQQTKAALNIVYAWPPNDPDSDYHNLTVMSIYGNRDYIISIPDNVIKK